MLDTCFYIASLVHRTNRSDKHPPPPHSLTSKDSIGSAIEGGSFIKSCKKNFSMPF